MLDEWIAGRALRRRASAPPSAGPPHPAAPTGETTRAAGRTEFETYAPWFDTVDGDLPPILLSDDELESGAGAAATSQGVAPGGDEVVDAEWVIEIGKGIHTAPRGPLLDPGPLTRQILRAVGDRRFRDTGRIVVAAFREGRWGWRQIALLLGAVALAALILFVPLPLGGPPPDADDPGAGGAVTALPTFPAAPPVDASPTAQPTAAPTHEPHRQGWIAFASNREGTFDIYLLDMVRGTARPLTAGGGADRYPAWSPDGSQIVFASDRAGDDNLYVVDTGGGEPVQVTFDPAADRFPAWSPDGSQIAFSREGAAGADLLILDTACLPDPASCEDTLHAVASGHHDLSPVWSPDGLRLAFAAADFPGAPPQIGLLTLGGETFTTLSGTGASDFDPAWSPDGLRLAFASNADDNTDVWLSGVSGGDPVPITHYEGTDVQPDWSPDGAFVVFASDRGEADSFDLFLVDVTCASDPEPACDDALLHLTSGPADDLDPAWSP
jgi:hypothetical protein